MFSKFYTTIMGQQYIAKSMEDGKKLALTKGAFGNGVMPAGSYPVSSTALVSKLGDMALTLKASSATKLKITTQFTNKVGSNVLPAFNLTEMGIYGKIQNTGGTDDANYPEALLFYGICSVEESDGIPAELTEFLINWDLEVSGDATIETVINESLVYATLKEANEMKASSLRGYYVSEEQAYSGMAGNYGIEVGRIEGKSVQNGTPTPDAPVEIKSFGDGCVDFVSHGYQLFDARRLATTNSNGATVTNNNDGSFTVSGTQTTNDFGFAYTYSHAETVSLLKAGKITLKTDTTTTPYLYVAFHKSSGQVLELTNSAGTERTGEILEEWLYDENFKMRIGFYATSGKSIVPGTIKPMLYQDGDGTWEPFHMETVSPQSNVITWDGDITGLEKHPTYPYYKVSDFTMPYSEACQKFYRWTMSENLLPMGKLSNPPQDDKSWMYLYGIMCVMDDSQGCSPGLYFYRGGGGDTGEPLSYVTAFYPEEPANVLTRLRSLPNGVCDTYEDGKITRRVGCKVLYGYEVWEQEEKFYYHTLTDKKNRKNMAKGAVLCSHFKEREINTTAAKIIIGEIFEGFYESGNRNIFIDYDDCAGGVGNFKTWLKSNPVTVLYELAEPVVEEVTIPVIPSWPPNTEVHHDSELDPASIEWRVKTAPEQYPVGSVLITATKENPSVKVGGTWELVEEEVKTLTYYYWKRTA